MTKLASHSWERVNTSAASRATYLRWAGAFSLVRFLNNLNPGRRAHASHKCHCPFAPTDQTASAWDLSPSKAGPFLSGFHSQLFIGLPDSLCFYLRRTIMTPLPSKLGSSGGGDTVTDRDTGGAVVGSSTHSPA